MRTLVALSAAAVLMMLMTGTVKGQTPLPEFTGQHLYVLGVPDIYQTLRPVIENIQQQSRQSYYVVVVASSGSGDFATIDYIDRLYSKWSSPSGRGGATLDTERSVLIVLAETNRQIAMRFGVELQRDFGLVGGTTINQQLVDPLFLPHAMAGNYPLGLEQLLRGTERWIQQREAERQQRIEEARRRQEEVRTNTQETIARARELFETAGKEMATARAAGLNVAPQQSLLEQAQQQFARLENTPDDRLAETFNEARTLNQQIQQLVDQLRQLPARQVEASEQLAELQGKLRQFDEQVEQARREGLLVGALQQRAGQLLSNAESVEQLVRTDPNGALESIASIRRAFSTAAQQLQELPALQQKLQQQQEEVAQLRSALDAQLVEARSRGTGIDDVQASLEQWDAEQQQAATRLPADYASALQQWDQLEQQLFSSQQTVRSRDARHVLLTRTLPLTALTMLLVLGAAIVSARVWWYRRRSRHVSELFEGFKKYAVELLDRMEAMKKRHQLLPFAQAENAVPLTGETLVFYEQFDDVHDQLRQKWLQLMDLREQLTLLLGRASVLKAAPLAEARGLIEKIDKQSIEADYEQAQQHLQRLEQGHATAAQKITDLETSLSDLRWAIVPLEKRGLQVAEHEQVVQQCQAVWEAAKQALPSDPLGVAQQLDKTLGLVNQQRALCSEIAGHAETYDRLAKRMEEALAELRQHRAEGLQLVQRDANPDPWFETAQQHHEALHRALNEADATSAAEQIAAMERVLDEAAAIVQHQLEARHFCEETLAQRSRLEQQSRQQLDQGHEQLRELQQAFARSGWADVARHVEQATEAAATAERLRGQAAAAADQQVQQYLQGRRLLEQAAQQQQRAAGLLAALAQRLEQLQQLRDSCVTQRQALKARAVEVQQFIEAQPRIVSQQARQLLATAQQLLARSDTLLQQTQPDWPAIAGLLDETAGGFMQAQQQAERDVAAYHQFTQKLAAAQQQAQRVAALLSGNSADRPRANYRFQTAQQQLEYLLSARDQQADWQDLVTQLDAALGDLQKAEQWAGEDIRLSRQAQQEIREAEREIQSAASFYGRGVSTDVRQAEVRLQEARRHLAAQEYEQAIRLADEAEMAARRARAEAERQAEQRRREWELQRRRQAQATVLSLPPIVFGQSSSSPWSGSRSSSSSSSSSSRSTSSSPSSSRSWSSPSSQRSW